MSEYLKKKSLEFIKKFKNVIEINNLDVDFDENELKSTSKLNLKCSECEIKVIKTPRNIMANPQNITCRSCGAKRGDIKGSVAYKKTMLDKYGVENPLQIPEIKEKVHKTNLEKGNYSKARAAFKEKHGVENPFELDSVKGKIKETVIERYGVDHINKLPGNKENLKNRMIEINGIASPLKHEMLKRNGCETYGEFCTKVVNFLETNKVNANTDLAESEFQTSGSTLIVALRSVGRGDLVNKFCSSQEQEIYEFVQGIIPNEIVSRNDRTVIKPKELDIYIPSKKVAIEFHGLIWHSEKYQKDKNYHYSKYLACKEHGIELLQIFEHEWKKNKEKIKQFIKNKLTKKETVYARKCTLVSDKKKLQKYIQDNHLQGSAPSRDYLGLECEGELVMAISISMHHRGLDQKVLNRVCYSKYHVVGGLNKLLKYSDFDELLTWNDHRYSPMGTMYKNAGFEFSGELRPDYFYTDGNKAISKQSQMKSKTNCPEGMTEHQWCLKRGLFRIYDAGKTRWIIKKS